MQEWRLFKGNNIFSLYPFTGEMMQERAEVAPETIP
jgi:hypothetical protein